MARRQPDAPDTTVSSAPGAERKASDAAPAGSCAQAASASDLERYARNEAAIRRLAGLASATPLAPGEAPPQAAAALLGDLRILVPMAGLIDVEAELARLARRRGKVEQELAKANAKLANANFVKNAPVEVVTQERERLEGFKRELAQLAEQHERVASLR